MWVFVLYTSDGAETKSKFSFFFCVFSHFPGFSISCLTPRNGAKYSLLGPTAFFLFFRPPHAWQRAKKEEKKEFNLKNSGE